MDLFEQNAGKACRQVRLRCTWISLVLVLIADPEGYKGVMPP